MTKCPHCNKEINLGYLMGKNSRKNITKEKASEIGRIGANARWAQERLNKAKK